ncbi:hypothetical protein [Sphaerisporangium corydalis]|uniref:Uncharacterized protein n=1 Tax=Sphaerisporangium corydalis TaxID=1441875 RepID=A0ABV9ESV3_9ACTN|nr:hypothetical protein [Sphaerisporangium corydalis]
MPGRLPVFFSVGGPWSDDPCGVPGSEVLVALPAIAGDDSARSAPVSTATVHSDRRLRMSIKEVLGISGVIILVQMSLIFA